MSEMARITVTLPADIVDEIDRLERNRSRFVLEGVRREIQRRRREALRLSLRAPHPDSAAIADEGFDDWAKGLPAPDDLLDPAAGTPVQWTPGVGWREK
jgi:hypothetical protein